MNHILLLNKISKTGLSLFDAERYACSDKLTHVDGILVRSADMLSFEFEESTVCVGRAGAGTNNIPVERCSEEGIVVFNTPGANANAVKELAVCALLLGSRRVVESVKWVDTLKDEGAEIAALVEKGKSNFAGPELAGKSLGVIGLGAVGARLANTAVDLGMEVYGYDPYLTVDAAWSLSRAVKQAKDEKSLYESCDYLSIHIPYNKETAGKYDEKLFSLMKDGVRIINLARGELVNNADLLAALESGKVASYVTDFPHADLIGAKNVVCIPHLAASTPESEENCAVMAVRQVADYIENGNIRNSVNFPDVELPQSGCVRLCVIHKNIPKMLNSITNVFSEAGINIENMVNKSKKDYAYTVVQTKDEIAPGLSERLLAVDGIIRLRVLHEA